MATTFWRSARVAAAVLLGLPACSSSPKLGEAAPASAFDSITEDLLAAARLGSEPPVLEALHFDFDSHELRGDAQRRLEQHAALLRAHPRWSLEIEGHADERGNEVYNLGLGERRAAAAAAYLARRGIEPARLRARSLGEAEPARSAHDESAWRANRRAELRVAKL